MNSALPASLIDYREVLEDAARRDLGRSRDRRRRGLVLRSALAAAVVAAVALGALSLVARHGAGGSVVDRAAAAVASSPGTIVHVDMLGSQTNGDGSVITWRNESWEQQGSPQDGREIQTAPDGSIVETATANGRSEVYDRARNTIYVAPPVSEKPYAMDKYDIKPGPRPGTALLRVGDIQGGHILSTAVITTAQAKALRKGIDVLAFRIGAKAAAAPTVTAIPRSSLPKPPPSSGDSSGADLSSADSRGQILALLRSGEAHVVGHRTIHGQDTIELASADGHTTYFVDPGSYKPVELRTTGTDGGTALWFRTYETLPAGSNGNLLSLTARHPDARIDRDPADYQAAETRLFPHG